MTKMKKSDIEEVFSGDDDAPGAPMPAADDAPPVEHKWETREKRPSTIQVREAVPGEKVGDHVCRKGDYVVKGIDGALSVESRKSLDTEFYPPVVESTPDVSGRWKIEIKDSALVPFEFKTRNGVPDRRLIAETLEAVRTQRNEAEQWNAANPTQKRKVPPYPTIPGVFPGEMQIAG